MELLIILGLAVFIVLNIMVITALASLVKLTRKGAAHLDRTAELAKGTLKNIDNEVSHMRDRVDESFDSVGKALITSTNYLVELRTMTTNVNDVLKNASVTLITINDKTSRLDELKPAVNHTANIVNLSCLEFIATLRKIDYSIERFTADYSPAAKFINNAYTNYYKPVKKVYSMMQFLRKGFGLFKKKK